MHRVTSDHPACLVAERALSAAGPLAGAASLLHVDLEALPVVESGGPNPEYDEENT